MTFSLVDAGTGIRRLGNLLIEDQRYTYHFLITHGHWDHLMGWPFFKPLYLDHVTIRVHRCPFPKKFVENMVSKVMTPPELPDSSFRIAGQNRLRGWQPHPFRGRFDGGGTDPPEPSQYGKWL